MHIYLIRHTKAHPIGENGISKDEDRPLSSSGEEQAKQLAQTFQHRGVKFDLVLSTPLLRARQTAEIILQNMSQSKKPDLMICDEIAPECKPRKMAKVLRSLQQERIAIVGHQPDLSHWAAWLIGSKKAYLEFAKGGAAYINWDCELSKGTGVLMWLITPKWYDEAGEPSEIEAVGV